MINFFGAFIVVLSIQGRADSIEACKTINWNRFAQLVTDSDSANKSLLFGEMTASMQKYYFDNCTKIDKSSFPLSTFHANSETSCVSKCRTSPNNRLDDSPWLDFLIGSPYTRMARGVGNRIMTISANDCKIACHALVQKAKGYFAGFADASEKCKSAGPSTISSDKSQAE